jgi:ketosteroid isomerase-like protein
VSESGAETLRRLYATWNDAGLDAAAEAFFDDDIEWHEAPQIPGAAVHRGRDAAVEYLRGLVDTVGGFRVEVEEVVPAGAGRWLASFRMIGEAPTSGVPFDAWNAHLATVREGRIVEVRHFLDPQEASAAAR